MGTETDAYEVDPRDYAQLSKAFDYRNSKFYTNMNGSGDPRVSRIISWIATLFSLVLVTMLSIWFAREDKYHDTLDAKLQTLNDSVIVLKDRPIGVSRDEFLWNMEKINQRFDTDEKILKEGYAPYKH